MAAKMTDCLRNVVQCTLVAIYGRFRGAHIISPKLKAVRISETTNFYQNARLNTPEEVTFLERTKQIFHLNRDSLKYITEMLCNITACIFCTARRNAAECWTPPEFSLGEEIGYFTQGFCGFSDAPIKCLGSALN
jgi:hypothetical protein